MTYQALFICKGSKCCNSPIYPTIAECKAKIPTALEKHKDEGILKTFIIARDGRQVFMREYNNE